MIQRGFKQPIKETAPPSKGFFGSWFSEKKIEDVEKEKPVRQPSKSLNPKNNVPTATFDATKGEYSLDNYVPGSFVLGRQPSKEGRNPSKEPIRKASKEIPKEEQRTPSKEATPTTGGYQGTGVFNGGYPTPTIPESQSRRSSNASTTSMVNVKELMKDVTLIRSNSAAAAQAPEDTRKERRPSVTSVDSSGRRRQSIDRCGQPIVPDKKKGRIRGLPDGMMRPSLLRTNSDLDEGETSAPATRRLSKESVQSEADELMAPKLSGGKIGPRRPSKDSTGSTRSASSRSSSKRPMLTPRQITGGGRRKWWIRD